MPMWPSGNLERVARFSRHDDIANRLYWPVRWWFDLDRGVVVRRVDYALDLVMHPVAARHIRRLVAAEARWHDHGQGIRIKLRARGGIYQQAGHRIDLIASAR